MMIGSRFVRSLHAAVLVAAALIPGQPAVAQQAPTPPDSPQAAEQSPGVTYIVGIEVVSRYVWRGKVYSDVVNLQPHALVRWRSIDVSTWGSYSTNSDWQEQDLAIMYTHSTASAGTLIATLNDYFYPSYGGEFAKPFNYAGVKAGVATGAHTLEWVGSYVAPKVPLTFTVGWNFYNDPDRALYGEVAANRLIRGFEAVAAAGWALNTSAYYEAKQGDLINLTLSVKRGIPIRPNYSIYLSAAVVRNPVLGGTYSVFTLFF